VSVPRPSPVVETLEDDMALPCALRYNSKAFGEVTILETLGGVIWTFKRFADNRSTEMGWREDSSSLVDLQRKQRGHSGGDIGGK
jgi:hypothetical protein